MRRTTSGVTRFFEGATKEGLTLASRALDSQWLDLQHTREVKDAAEAWRVLMLLEAGELAEARRHVERSKVRVTAGAAVAHETAYGFGGATCSV